MAEALSLRILKRLGMGPVEVRSAGVHTDNGMRASEGARRAVERHGLSLEEHSSTVLTEDLVEWADNIFVMGPGHLQMVELFGGGDKAHLLAAFAKGLEGEEGPADLSTVTVPDPFGGDDALYDRTFETLEDYVESALKRLREEWSE
jgi:protein-tyrosine phosphatase